MKQGVDHSRESQGLYSWFCYKTWFPFRTLRSVLILSITLGVIFFALAILQIGFYLKSHEYEVIYANSQSCMERTSGGKCESILQITQDLQPPIAFIYFIQNAYINHRKYIDSFSPEQLAGKTVDLQKATKECAPFVLNQKMNETESYTGQPLDPNFIASPCGFSSHLAFTDTFSLYNRQGKQISINEKGLFQNVYGQFKRPADSESTQWIDPQNDHFMLWMKNSGLITKYKLWGRIEQPLPAGKYNVVVDNNYFIGEMRIKKGVKIVNMSAIGSPFYFYPIMYTVMGIICFAYAIFMKRALPDYDQLLKEFEQNKK